jgi:hypothetical protein
MSRTCHSPRVGATLALIASAPLLVIACGNDTVDSKQIEDQIKHQLTSATVPITSVSCPADVEKKQGNTFTCKTKLEGGGKAEVEVTQVNGHNQYTYAFKPGSLVITDSTLEPAVKKDLEARGLSISSVSCPQEIAVKPGETVTCTATTEKGAQTKVTFTLTSEGDVDDSSLETS